MLMDWRIDLDSHGMIYWECQLNNDDRVFAGASDWKSVLRCVARMSCLLEFPDRDSLKCFDDMGKNCIMDFNAGGTCPQIRAPGGCMEVCAQTLPTRQESRGSDVPSGITAQVRGSVGVSPGEMGCADDWGYIRPVTDDEWPVCSQPVTGSLLFGSPLRRVLGLPQPNLPSEGLKWTICSDICFSCRSGWWIAMSSGVDLPTINQTGTAPAVTDPLPGTFLGLELDLESDKLYDLGGALPDVMGLRATQPRAAVVKVMTVPDSRCVRVVVPDDHVSIGFHEILIHDMADEELPFVAVCELGCLRLDWPGPYLRLWHDISLIWIRCGRNAGNGLVPHSREPVLLVVSTFSRIWADMSPYTIWSWHSYGDARGVRSGKVHLKTVSIT